MPAHKKSPAKSKSGKKKPLPKHIYLSRLGNNLVSRATKINKLYKSLDFQLFGIKLPGNRQNNIHFLTREQASKAINDIFLFSRLFKNYHRTLVNKADILGKSVIGFRHLTINIESFNNIAKAYLELKKKFPDLAKKKLSDF